VTRRFAILRTLASCLLAVSLIAEWPLALALSSQHVARALQGSNDVPLCLAGTAGQSLPAKPAGAPAKIAPCPICQGIHAAQAPLPDAIAVPHPVLLAGTAIAPDSAAVVAGGRIDAKQPRGPPFA
jgi:hypothetical protein